MMMGTQLGKTAIAQFGLSYLICNNPQTILLAFPNIELRRRWFEQKLKAGLEKTPAVKERLIYNRTGELGLERIKFHGGSIWTAISGSEASMSNIDAPLVIADELDKFVPQADADNPVSSLESRGEAFEGREKLILISSPTTTAGA